MRVLRALMFGFAVTGACVLVLAGCTTGGASSGIEGTWLVTYDSPIEYDTDEYADAQIFEFSDSEIEMIFYLDTEQVMGQRGTYTTSGDTLSLAFDEWWNSDTLSWESDDDAIDLTFSRSGDTLSITPPGETQPVDLAKTSFGMRSELAGNWYGTGAISGDTLELQSDCEFAYLDDVLPVQMGTWSASADYICSVDKLSGWKGYLNPYALQDSGSTLVIDVDGGGQQTYGDTVP